MLVGGRRGAPGHCSGSAFHAVVVQAAGGTLCGRRVLDMPCNSASGRSSAPSRRAEVNRVRRAAGADRAGEPAADDRWLRKLTFRVLDFWDMNEAALGGRFDVVLNLGVLYHLPDPLQALERTRRMGQA